MVANTTSLLSLTIEMTPNLFLSAELALEINRIFYFVVLPCVSVLAIMGNVSNIVILTRQGFNKSSNKLLLSLAVSDILLAFGVNNIPYFLYAQNEPLGFRFSESVSYICYVLHLVIRWFYCVGAFSAPFIPVLITGERIVAIFCPFKVSLIVTPRGILITVSSFYVAGVVVFLYEHIFCEQFKQTVSQGVSIGRIIVSDMLLDHAKTGLYLRIIRTINYVMGIVPISLVAGGCVIIGLKIIQITNKRRHLTSSQGKVTTKQGITKTTRTLLSICVLYIACYGFAFILSDLANRSTLIEQWTLLLLIARVLDLVLCLNCLGDFLIYFSASNRFMKPNMVDQRIKT